MNNKLIYLLVFILFVSFTNTETLKGTWEFGGGIYNGKKEGSPSDYTLQRKYNNQHYEAFLIEKDTKPEKYEAGDYILKGDTCIETQTYSSRPSKLTGIPVAYLYTVHNDTLTLKATLPSGMRVEEYWKREK
jgi:hypothetical protein